MEIHKIHVPNHQPVMSFIELPFGLSRTKIAAHLSCLRQSQQPRNGYRDEISQFPIHGNLSRWSFCWPAVEVIKYEHAMERSIVIIYIYIIIYSMWCPSSQLVCKPINYGSIYQKSQLLVYFQPSQLILGASPSTIEHI